MFWNLGPVVQAFAIFAGGLGGATVARLLVIRLGGKIVRGLGLYEWERGPIRATAWLVSAWVLVFAGYVALHRLALTPAQTWWLDHATAAIITLLVAAITSRFVSAILDHYTRQVARRGATAGILNLANKLLQVVIILIAVLLVAEQFNYRFTAVLAGLGLISLGVGLALQDTLANFFAGLWLSLDRPLTRGDYIDLGGGQAGWVMEVGWRFSRLATWDENYLIVPNSRFANTIFVNNTGRDSRSSLYIECRASYEADLDAVERIAMQVARDVQDSVEGVVKDFEPVVLFRSFEDFYIRFSVGFQILTREARRVTISEFIRQLKARFHEEGIEVTYPVTEVRLQAGRKYDLTDAAPMV